MSSFTHKSLKQIDTGVVTVNTNPQEITTGVKKYTTPLLPTIEFVNDKQDGDHLELNDYGWEDLNNVYALDVANNFTSGIDIRYRVFEVII